MTVLRAYGARGELSFAPFVIGGVYCVFLDILVCFIVIVDRQIDRKKILVIQSKTYEYIDQKTRGTNTVFMVS